jgi:hypothetical protein
MPRGQGWGAAGYQGARSLKCFPVSEDIVALSTSTVTHQQDEMGRKGIRRAEIEFILMRDILAHLRAMVETYPEEVRRGAEQAFSVKTWAQIIDRALPKLRGKPSQVVFSHPFGGAEDWRVIEAIVLNLALAWPLHAMPGWGKFFSFTTLALTNEAESRIVAIPAEKARDLHDGKAIRVAEGRG